MLLPGRLFSRAFLAVQLASGSDDGRPMLYRTVRIEQYGTGVQLIATDGYWLARAWVPRVDLLDNLTHVPPPIDELPDRAATLVDDEWRVRDLMRHIAKITRKPDDAPIDVRLDLAATTYDDVRPTLSPEMAARRVRVELPDRERVLAVVFDSDEWVEWRGLIASFDAEPPAGTDRTMVADWMLTALAKIPRLFEATVLDISWINPNKGSWTIAGSSYDFTPSGLLMAVTTPASTHSDHDAEDDAA